MKIASFMLAALCHFPLSALGLDPVSISGSKFFNKDGSQFFIKGIAYQRSQADPLLDPDQCKTDAALMSKLGANAIRIYHVSSVGDHDPCMKAFDDNGIYMFIDTDTFTTQIEQDGPPHWNSSQLERFTDVIHAFAKYDNVAGFFVGNEVITRSNGSAAAPYVRAATRDVKSWIKKQKFSRDIYVGYSAADIAELRPNLQNYLVCGDDDSSKIDFFGLNAYEWCGKDSSYKISGYDQLTKNATDYPVPIFFSETGCNTATRDFADQAAIFGPDMNKVWSGAIIYEWIQEANNYGIISYAGEVNTKSAIGGDAFVRSGEPTPLSDFTALSKAWAKATPTGVSSKDYKPNSAVQTCPASTKGIWNVDPSAALPSLGETAAPTPTGTGTQNGAKPSATKKSVADRYSATSKGKTIALILAISAAVWIL